MQGHPGSQVLRCPSGLWVSVTLHLKSCGVMNNVPRYFKYLCSCSSKMILHCETRANCVIRDLPAVLLKIQVVWDVTLCRWDSSFQRMLIPSFSGLSSQLTVKMETLQSFETSGTSRPETKHNIPESLCI